MQQDEFAPKRLDALTQRVKAAADPKARLHSVNRSVVASGAHSWHVGRLEYRDNHQSSTAVHVATIICRAYLM